MVLSSTKLLDILVLVMLATACHRDARGGDRETSAPIELMEDGAIGDLDTFGSIDDIETDSVGRLYVLDRYAKQIHVFDPEGRLLGVLGRPGGGPGEFQYPVSIAVQHDGAVVVYDVSNTRISIFRPTGREWVLDREIRVPLSGSDMCMLAGRIMVLGLLDGKVLHVISEDGAVTTSFGDALSDDPIMAEITSIGHVVCDEERSLIVLVHGVVPRVRAFAKDGTPRWDLELPNYHATIYDQSAGYITPTIDETGQAHTAEGAAMLDSGVLLVQLGLRTRGSGTELAALETRFVSLATGSQTGARADLPRIVLARGNRVFGIRSDPFPQVVIYTIAQ